MTGKMKLFVGVIGLAVLGAAAFVFLDTGERKYDDIASGPLEINFNNNVYDDIIKWELSPAGQNNYSELALTDGVMNPGESETHSIEDGQSICVFDLRITKDDGSTAEHLARNLCDATYYTYFDEYPITFVNNTGKDLRNVMATANYGEASLGHGFTLPDGIFKAGATLVYSIPQVQNSCKFGYTFDFQMGVYGSQDTLEAKDIDLCEKWTGGTVELAGN